MNVGEILREIDRLNSVIDEAKNAKVKIKEWKRLAALYADGDDTVTLLPEPAPANAIECDVCGDGPFKGKQGLGMHKSKAHGIPSQHRNRAS